MLLNYRSYYKVRRVRGVGVLAGLTFDKVGGRLK